MEYKYLLGVLPSTTSSSPGFRRSSLNRSFPTMAAKQRRSPMKSNKGSDRFRSHPSIEEEIVQQHTQQHVQQHTQQPKQQPKRSSSPRKVRMNAKSLGFGSTSLTESPVGVRVNMECSIAALTASLDTSRDCNFSLGSSSASADSFVLALEEFSSDDDNDRERRSTGFSDFDPYIGRRRRRRPGSTKHSVQHHRHGTVLLNDSMDDYMTAKECASRSTSPETTPSSPSPPSSKADVGEGPLSAWSLSLPKSLQLPQMVIPRFRVSVPTEDAEQRSGHISRGVSEPQITRIVLKEQTYWDGIVNARTRSYGKVHARTAEAYMDLGQANMRVKEYKEALEAFQSAYRILKKLHGPFDLTVARASDSVGLALLRSEKTNSSLQKARKSLDVAFTIRYHQLGPWHVDTVDTFNKIAGVHLHLLEFREACKAYKEVYVVRKAIFGEFHPSVAISAHSLANVHFHLSETDESLNYYNIALEVYTRMNLKTNHPTVARLLKDRKRLERVMMAEMCVQLDDGTGYEYDRPEAS